VPALIGFGSALLAIVLTPLLQSYNDLPVYPANSTAMAPRAAYGPNRPLLTAIALSRSIRRWIDGGASNGFRLNGSR